VNLIFQKRIQMNLISDWISRSTSRSRDNPFVPVIYHVGNDCISSEITQSYTPKDDSSVELVWGGEIRHFSKTIQISCLTKTNGTGFFEQFSCVVMASSTKSSAKCFPLQRASPKFFNKTIILLSLPCLDPFVRAAFHDPSS
jgi:hypothetical protein